MLNNLTNLYKDCFNVDESIVEFVNSAQNGLTASHLKFQEMAEYNQAKILSCMRECKIGSRHFAPSTGYGYGDDSRDKLDELFARVFGSEDALVRTQWASATHALHDCLFSVLKSGDCLLSITGKPYDTLDKTIGLNDYSDKGSLKFWDIAYKQIELKDNGSIDIDSVLAILDDRKIRLIFIQRSRGYSLRPSLTVSQIKQAIENIKFKRPDLKVLVDNCYGEFTGEMEPSQVGADLTVGSLIKNPGGGLAPTGAYVVGTKESIGHVAIMLTTPGLGREVGSYAATYSPFYQGLFLAPHVVSEVLKGNVLTAKVFKSLGYRVFPDCSEAVRSDIIQTIQFRCEDELVAFCQAVQSASPVDSHVTPYPWDMPGYSHKVIMAAGTFVQGASIELSADAPIKEPYLAFMQGGLTFAHIKTALMIIIACLKERGHISETLF